MCHLLWQAMHHKIATMSTRPVLQNVYQAQLYGESSVSTLPCRHPQSIGWFHQHGIRANQRKTILVWSMETITFCRAFKKKQQIKYHGICRQGVRARVCEWTEAALGAGFCKQVLHQRRRACQTTTHKGTRRCTETYNWKKIDFVGIFIKLTSYD